MIGLINADQEYSLFEFALQQVIIRHLDPHFERDRALPDQSYTRHEIQRASINLLSALSYLGNRESFSRTAAFERGLKTLNPMATLSFDSSKTYTVDDASLALEVLVNIPPRSKQSFLEACVACVAADNTVSLEEAEFLRAIADALECPVPPFLPGQSMANA
jgi:hypothetical protein